MLLTAVAQAGLSFGEHGRFVTAVHQSKDSALTSVRYCHTYRATIKRIGHGGIVLLAIDARPVAGARGAAGFGEFDRRGFVVREGEDLFVVGHKGPIAGVVVVVDGDVGEVGHALGEPGGVFGEGLGGDLACFVADDGDGGRGGVLLGGFDSAEDGGAEVFVDGHAFLLTGLSQVIRFVHRRNVLYLNPIANPIRKNFLNIVRKRRNLRFCHIPATRLPVACDMGRRSINEEGDVRHAIALRHLQESNTCIVPREIIGSIRLHKRLDP